MPILARAESGRPTPQSRVVGVQVGHAVHRTSNSSPRHGEGVSRQSALRTAQLAATARQKAGQEHASLLAASTNGPGPGVLAQPELRRHRGMSALDLAQRTSGASLRKLRVQHRDSPQKTAGDCAGLGPGNVPNHRYITCRHCPRPAANVRVHVLRRRTHGGCRD